MERAHLVDVGWSVARSFSGSTEDVVRRLMLIAFILTLLAGASLLPRVRSGVRGLIRREPPLQITPLSVSLPATAYPTARQVPSATPEIPTAVPPSPTPIALATRETTIAATPPEAYETQSTLIDPTATFTPEPATATLAPTDLPTSVPSTPIPTHGSNASFGHGEWS